MPTLYVTEPGALIEKEYQRLLVTKDDEVLLRLPLQQVSEVVITGAVGLTTPAMLALLDAGVRVSLITAGGRLRGRLVPETPRNIFLRQVQYRQACDPAFCLAIARQVVVGKLSNQRTLARRMSRFHPGVDAALAGQIGVALRQAQRAADLATLRGLEGKAGRMYFKVFRQALPPDWSFPRRSRRPPLDPANALLSLGYSLLGQNAVAALEIVGLDPCEGFFHADRDGRPALALDLIEEFRPVLVDALALSLAWKRTLKPDDFTPQEGGGILLSQRGLRKFLAAYSRKLQSEVLHPLAGRRLSYQKCLEVQAWQLRKAIQDPSLPYRPFRAR